MKVKADREESSPYAGKSNFLINHSQLILILMCKDPLTLGINIYICGAKLAFLFIMEPYFKSISVVSRINEETDMIKGFLGSVLMPLLY